MADPTDQPAAEADSSSDASLLLQYLAENDAPCPVCGYNLHNLTRDVCPECGQQFKLTIGSVSPHLGTLLLFLAPMITMAGFGLIILVTFATAAKPPPSWGPLVIVLAGALDTIVIVAIHHNRKAFFRSSRTAKWVLIALSWLAHGLVVSISIGYG